MTTRDRPQIAARRFVLENPYAHIEQLSEQSTADASIGELRSARLTLQNQYAYADEIDAASANLTEKPVRKHALSLEKIQRAARDMQKALWREREKLWVDDAPASPIAILDPAKACELFSFAFEVVDSLGIYTERREPVGVAGQIDRQEKIIRISREFDPEIQLFTAAHEVGHLLLHPHIDRLHRDRGLNGVGISRDRIEWEADKFAVFFLLPEKLVRNEFEHRFLAQEFLLNEETLFALEGGARNRGDQNLNERRRLARRLASALNYNGRNFHSLASHFGVTTETMAIRLEELRIV